MSHQAGEWRDHLYSRRRSCARRLSAADQHRSRRRPALGTDDRVLTAMSATRWTSFSGAMNALPAIAATMPPELRITPIADQSVFVLRGAMPWSHSRRPYRRLPYRDHDPGLSRQLAQHGHHCGVHSAVDSVLADHARALGETINIMTLGGLALAVGILVDDATVEIENINRNLEVGKEVEAGDV